MVVDSVSVNRNKLNSLCITAIIVSSLVILTTGWAQDFQDQAGDLSEGYTTIPLIAPRVSRAAMPVGLIAWSVALRTLWGLEDKFALPFLGFAAFVGRRFWGLTTVEEDRLSFMLYNVRQ